MSSPSPHDLLTQARSAVFAFAGLDLAGRPADELAMLALEVQRLANQAHAAVLHTTAAFDASGAWELDGAASAAAWIRVRAHLTTGAARGLVRDARATRDSLPHLSVALAEGETTAAHIRAVASVLERYPERRDTIVQVESTLADVARDLDPAALRIVVDRWTATVDPQTAVDDEAERHASRALSASRTLDGMVAIDGLLDPDNGAAVLTALDAIMQRDHCADDPRTPRQQRADALGELAREVLDGGVLGVVGGERPHVHVTIPWSVVADQTAVGATFTSGSDLTAEGAWRYLCDASIVPVLEGRPGEVLDVGRSRRTIPPAIRRAVVRRNIHCVFAGCDARPERCEAHHLVPWAHGGRTSLDNLALLCRRHHRSVHTEGFVLLGTPGTNLRTVRPDGSAVADPLARARMLRRAELSISDLVKCGVDPP